MSTTLYVEDRVVPGIVSKCIAEIEERGLYFEGLYRKPGSTAEINALTKSFNHSHYSNQEVDMSEMNISSITSLVKRYFRELPDIIPSYRIVCELSEHACSPSKVNENTIEDIKEILQCLPPGHIHTLSVFMRHLNLVSLHSSKNFMDSCNLALVVAPSLFHPHAKVVGSGKQVWPEMTTVTDIFIKYADLIFDDPSKSLLCSSEDITHGGSQKIATGSLSPELDSSTPVPGIEARIFRSISHGRRPFSCVVPSDIEDREDRSSHDSRSKNRMHNAKKRLTRLRFGK